MSYEYLQGFGFVATSGDDENPHDYYIPENIFYRLCMKAKNAVAEKFQAKVADEIIPSIKKSPIAVKSDTFSCDVDGKHIEITIPADAWDLENETVWLTQAQFAELYRVNVPAVNKQIQNIFEDGELQEDATISKMEIVQIEGNREVSREVTHYNLDMLLSLGYRIRSKAAYPEVEKDMRLFLFAKGTPYIGDDVYYTFDKRLPY